jgi:hypothetical protein
MAKDPFAVLKTIFKPRTVVSQQNDFYKVYRVAYSDKRLFYRQSLTVLAIILLTIIFGASAYSALAETKIIGIQFGLWVAPLCLLFILALIPIFIFTLKPGYIAVIISTTILLSLLPLIKLSLGGNNYWQLLILPLAFLGLCLIGMGRMKMTAENSVDFSWWQISNSGLKYFIYAYLCLISVFGFWMVKTGAIKQSINLEKNITQSVTSQFKNILPQINIGGSIDDFLSGIINSQVDSSLNVSGITTTKPPSGTKTKVTLPSSQDLSTLVDQEAAKQKNLILTATREKLSQLLDIPITGKETIFGLVKSYITNKSSTWGSVPRAILVIFLILALWQLLNLFVAIFSFFANALSYLLLKILLGLKFLQFKTVNIPHKTLALNEE